MVDEERWTRYRQARELSTAPPPQTREKIAAVCMLMGGSLWLAASWLAASRPDGDPYDSPVLGFGWIALVFLAAALEIGLRPARRWWTWMGAAPFLTLTILVWMPADSSGLAGMGLLASYLLGSAFRVSAVSAGGVRRWIEKRRYLRRADR